jgi:WD40 repeat protein
MHLQVALLMILGIVPAQNGANVCPLATFKGGWNSIEGVAFSPDGKTIASGCLDGSLKLWDVTTHRERRKQMLNDHIYSLTFSPKGTTIAVGHFKQVTVVDAETGKEAATLKGHEAAVGSLAIAPSGKLLASASGDGTVRIWDMEKEKSVFTLRGHDGAVLSVAFCPDGKTVASGGQDGTVRIWDVVTGKQRAKLASLFHWFTVVPSVAYSPDGEKIAAGYGGCVKLWDVASGRSKTVARQDNSVTSVAFTRDGKWLATGNLESEVRVWEIATGRECFTWKHGGPVNSVAFSPDGTLLASGTDENTVKLWSLKKRKSE